MPDTDGDGRNETAYPNANSIPFPYARPYPQQHDFMQTILSSLQRIEETKDDCLTSEKKTGIIVLESPTGTGKSLSLACAALSWLRFAEKRDLSKKEVEEEKTKRQVGNESGSSGSNWLQSWSSTNSDNLASVRGKSKSECRLLAMKTRGRLEKKLDKIRDRIAVNDDDDVSRANVIRGNLARSAVTSALMDARKSVRRGAVRRCYPKKGSEIGAGDDFCVDEYESNEEDSCSSDSDDDTTLSNLTSATALPAPSVLDGGSLDGSGSLPINPGFQKAKPSADKMAIGGVSPGSGIRKIIYAARTHSQLSQFIGEIRRTAYGRDARIIPLGSRKLLCGYEPVRGPPNRKESVITERCLDLQKGVKDGKKRKSVQEKGTKCPLLVSKEAMAALAVNVLAKPTDIEDLASLGRAANVCSYYASRESLAAAEIVVLPYNTLFSPQSRSALGLSLRNSLVIIDEAHNIPETLRSISSCRITLPIIQMASKQVTSYTSHYSNRLTPRNLMYLGQITRCLMSMTKYLNKHNTSSTMAATTEFLFTLKLDMINFFKIGRYLQKSRLSQKLLGFYNHSKRKQKHEPEDTAATPDPLLSKHISPLSVVQTFFECLNDNTGKIISEWPLDSDPNFRYVLLQPWKKFTALMEAQPVAIVLAGGTLKPFSHLASELFPDFLCHASKADTVKTYTSPEFTSFSCGHIVPSSHIILKSLTLGPTNVTLDFRHSSRMKDDTCDELGRVLGNLINVVPAGLVVFLPSYSYEAHLLQRWRGTGQLNRLKAKKVFYREPKSASAVEETLQSYEKECSRGNGAILFCVVGGKMSEGINFADDMARCVVMVGLPYADITCLELKEKMALLDRAASAQPKQHARKGSINGRTYYHNLCMRAVNQSIGRAIRHKGDYAAVVLVDRRYAEDSRVWEGLPLWLRGESKAEKEPFGRILFGLRNFFRERERKREIIAPR